MPVKLAMMKATNRDRVLIADFAAQRARLGKAKMMRIGWFAAAHHAWRLNSATPGSSPKRGLISLGFKTPKSQ